MARFAAPNPGKGRKRPSWPTVVAGCVLFLVSAGIAMFAGIVSLLGSSEVAYDAVQHARRHPAVHEVLGDRFEQGYLVLGRFDVSGDTGRAELSIPLVGAKGSGTVYISSIRASNKWLHQRIEFAPSNGGPRIDILKRPAPKRPPASYGRTIAYAG